MSFISSSALQWADVGNRGRAILRLDPAAELGEITSGFISGFVTGTASVPAAELGDAACFLADVGGSEFAGRFFAAILRKTRRKLPNLGSNCLIDELLL